MQEYLFSDIDSELCLTSGKLPCQIDGFFIFSIEDRPILIEYKLLKAAILAVFGQWHYLLGKLLLRKPTMDKGFSDFNKIPQNQIIENARHERLSRSYPETRNFKLKFYNMNEISFHKKTGSIKLLSPSDKFLFTIY